MLSILRGRWEHQPAGAAAVTVAVKVTSWLNTEMPADESTVMCVAPLVTVCAKAGDVLVRNMALPLYIAVMECVPTARLELVSALQVPVDELRSVVRIHSQQTISQPRYLFRSRGTACRENGSRQPASAQLDV